MFIRKHVKLFLIGAHFFIYLQFRSLFYKLFSLDNILKIKRNTSFKIPHKDILEYEKHVTSYDSTASGWSKESIWKGLVSWAWQFCLKTTAEQ